MKKNVMVLLFLICTCFSWSQTTLLQENFTSYAGTSATVPTGWNFSYNGNYTTTTSSGISGPNSYKFGATNATIISPAFASADSVRFWFKGLSTDTASYLTIFETQDSITWSQIVKIKPIPTTGITTHYALNTSSTHVKFVYTKSAGNIAFDDINIVKGGTAVTTSSNTQFYRASYRDDPSTTIVIGWCDNGTSTNAKVYYDMVDYGTTYTSYAFNHPIDRTQSAYSLNHHFARLIGLTPNTIYYFVIHDDAGTSARMYFKTLPDNPNVGITFIAGGDSRTGIITESGYALCRPYRQANDSLVGKISPDFVTFNGDFVYSGTTANWSDWFTDWQYTLGANAHLVPVIPVMGNHEASADMYNMFDVPITNDYFSLGIGGNLLRIYSLNSELSSEGCDATEKTWLTNDLQLYTGTASEPYWKFAQYHVPFVPHANYSANTTLSACWAPLFQTYNVKLANEAHAHCMAISYPIVQSTGTGSDHGFIKDTVNGTVYMGEGAFGAPLYTPYSGSGYYSSTQAYNWTRNQLGSTFGFQIVCVTKAKIEIRFAEEVNVGSVGQVQITDPVCTLPSGLTTWNMSNGNPVVLYYHGSITTGMSNEFKENQKILVTPIPAKDKVTISFPKLADDAQLEIYSSFGEKMKTMTIGAGTESKEINISDLDTGTYIAHLINKAGIQTCKIVHVH